MGDEYAMCRFGVGNGRPDPRFPDLTLDFREWEMGDLTLDFLDFLDFLLDFLSCHFLSLSSKLMYSST